MMPTANLGATVKIKHVSTEALATIVAGLVREGLTFEVVPGTLDGNWDITLTGGF